jgi:hypothetical protein
MVVVNTMCAVPAAERLKLLVAHELQTSAPRLAGRTSIWRYALVGLST